VSEAPRLGAPHRIGRLRERARPDEAEWPSTFSSVPTGSAGGRVPNEYASVRADELRDALAGETGESSQEAVGGSCLVSGS